MFKLVFFTVNWCQFIVNDDYLQESTSDKRLCASESIAETDEGPGDPETYFLLQHPDIKSQSRAYETAVFIVHAISDMKKT